MEKTVHRRTKTDSSVEHSCNGFAEKSGNYLRAAIPALVFLLNLAPAGTAGAQTWPSIQRHYDSHGTPDPAPTQFRYESVPCQVRYKNTSMRTDTVYEQRIITEEEPQTVTRTVHEDRGSWVTRQRRSLFGARTERVWVPRIVQVEVPEVVQVQRQRVERIPHEVTQAVVTTVAESIVVQARRPIPAPIAPAWDYMALRDTPSRD